MRAGAPARHNLHVLPEDVSAHKHGGAERAAQRSLSGPREQHPGTRGRGTRLYVGIASNSSGRASHTTVSTGSSIAYTSPATGPQLSRDPRTNLQRRRGARGSGQDPRGGRGGTRARTRARQRRSARGRRVGARKGERRRKRQGEGVEAFAPLLRRRGAGRGGRGCRGPELRSHNFVRIGSGGERGGRTARGEPPMSCARRISSGSAPRSAVRRARGTPPKHGVKWSDAAKIAKRPRSAAGRRKARSRGGWTRCGHLRRPRTVRRQAGGR